VNLLQDVAVAAIKSLWPQCYYTHLIKSQILIQNSYLKMKEYTTTTYRPTMMDRLRGRHGHRETVTTGTTRRRGGLFSHRVHHQKRHATLGDKISGAMLKLKGTLTHRPGVKAAGTRRMRGTDGRGSHRNY
jgi:hypothetical protein